MTTVKKSSVEVKEIVVPRAVASEFSRLLDMSSMIGREIGGIMCYSIDGSRMVLRDVINMTGSVLRESSYSYNPVAVDIASNLHCSNQFPAMFHTHPSGNPNPSIQDRRDSKATGHVNCVVTRSRLDCFLGDNDIPVTFR